VIFIFSEILFPLLKNNGNVEIICNDLLHIIRFWRFYEQEKGDFKRIPELVNVFLSHNIALYIAGIGVRGRKRYTRSVMNIDVLFVRG